MTIIFPRRGSASRFHKPAAAALFFLVVLSARRSANADSTESSQIEECRAGWAGFFKGLKSLRVEYTWRTDALADPAALKQYLGITGSGGTEVKHIFAFKGDQRYFSYDNSAFLPSGKAKKTAEHYEYAYNGRKRQMRSHDANWLGLDSAQNGRSKDDGGDFLQFYLRALFHVLPDVFSSNPRSTLRLPDALADEDVHVRPALEEIDGSRCVVVELRKSNRVLWADPRLTYALRQWEIRTPDTNRLIWRYHLRDYRPVAPGVQLPFLIVQDRGAPKAPQEFQNAPLMSWTFRVTHLDANNVPDSTFTLVVPAGVKVTDRTVAPGPVMYTAPADAKKLDSTIASAVARVSALTGGDAQSPSSWRNWIILATVNLLLLGALATALFVRRRRGRD
jgi:hypothetical protein